MVHAKCALGFLQAFCAFCLLGLVGVVVDVDHVLVLFWKGLPITWENLLTNSGRPLHIPLLVVSGVVCVCFGALLVRQVAVRENA